MKLNHILGITLLASAGAALAGTGAMHDSTGDDQTNATTPETTSAFHALDTNRDGYLSPVEAQNNVTNFDNADTNKDGRLDSAEFAQASKSASKIPDNSVGSSMHSRSSGSTY